MRFGVLAVAAAAVTALAGRVEASCGESLDALAGRTVREVRVSTTLGLGSPAADRVFFGTLGRTLTDVESSLPIRPGQPFTRAAYDAAQRKVTDILGLENLRTRERVRLTVVVPEVENCTDVVDVVYRVFTTDALSYLANVFESSHARISRDLVPPGAKLVNSHLIAPIFGYDASNGVYGGASVALAMKNALFSKLAVAGTGSTRGGVAGVRASGERDIGTALLDHGQWQVDFQHQNAPIANLTPSLISTTVAARFIGATRTTTNAPFLFRYGSTVEAGRRQSDLLTAADPYASIKAYVGASVGPPAFQGAMSYGVQAAQGGHTPQIAYVKHVVDVKFRNRLLTRPHVPLELESAFNAGWIEASGGEVPVAERFYGGTAPPQFLDADSWKIADGPQLRSFPQRAFNRAGDMATFGAPRFVSASFTFAPTVWHFAAVPDDILDDANLRSSLAFQLSSTKEAFIGDCAVRTSVFATVVEHVRPLKDVLKEMSDWRRHLHSMMLPDPVASALADVDDDSDTLEQTIAPVIAKRPNGAAFSAARRLAANEDVSPILQAALANEALAAALDGNGLSSEAITVRQSAKRLRELSMNLAAPFASVQALNIADPDKYTTVVQGLSGFRSALEHLERALMSLSDIDNDDVADLVDTVNTHLADTFRKLEVAEASSSTATMYDDLDTLLTDWGHVAPSSPHSLIEFATRLHDLLLVARLDAAGRLLEEPLAELKTAYGQVAGQFKVAGRPPLQSCAFGEAGFAVRVADTTFRELNVVQLSPVWILDVARLSSAHSTSEMRVGSGPGVRLSVATLNVTLAYALNLSPRASEPHGAFFFSLDVSDLFR